MRTLLSLAAVLVLLLTACGGDEETAAEIPPTPATTATPSPTSPTDATPTADPSPSPEPDPTPTPTPDPTSREDPTPPADEGIDPIGTFDDEPVEGGDFPSLAGDTAYLIDVRVAGHQGFDRVVLEFEGTAPPSYRVTELDPPIRQDGSGNEVDVDGDAFLELRMTPASGVDLSGPELDPTYDGPDRVTAPQTEVVTEVVRTGDFEANLAWVVGLERSAPFAVEWLSDPLRLVVDIEAP